MRKSAFLFIITFALIFSDLAQAQSKKAKELKQDYLKVAFWESNGKTLPLAKWEDEGVISYYIDGDMEFLSDKRWNRFLNEVETLTDLKFKKADDRSSAEILIFFGELQKYFELTNNNTSTDIVSKFNSWSNRKWNGKNQLKWSGFCIVPSQIRNSKQGAFYIRKLFLKSLGLLGSIDDNDSIYYDYFKTRNYRFKEPDKRMLKLHYNHKIKAGMEYQVVDSLLSNAIDLETLADEKL